MGKGKKSKARAERRKGADAPHDKHTADELAFEDEAGEAFRAEAAEYEKRERDCIQDEGHTWVRVDAPRPWRPLVAGDKVVGRYMGRQNKHGVHGAYQVVLMRVRSGEMISISGSAINNLFNSVEADTVVRVQFRGAKPWATDATKTYNEYEVWVDAKALGVTEVRMQQAPAPPPPRNAPPGNKRAHA